MLLSLRNLALVAPASSRQAQASAGRSSSASWLFGIGFLPAILACGTSSVTPVHLPPTSRSTIPPHLAPERVRVVEAPERPVLQLVRRKGDPHGAVALAAFPDGGSRSTIALGALFHARLRAAGFQRVRVQSHSFGLVVAAPATTPEGGARLLRALHGALAEPVSAQDPALPLVRQWLENNLPKFTPSATGWCAGALGTEPTPEAKEDFSPELLESWRQSAFAWTRVGVAALGSDELLEAVREAHDGEWPSATAPEQPWPESDEVHLLDDSTGRGLRLAWYLPNAAQALGAARALADQRHPLHQRLAALGVWRVGDTGATVRLRGACLRVTLDATETRERPAATELAEAVTVASLEVQRTLRGAPGTLEHERALLAPSDPEVAAALAAWSAVRGAEAPGSPRRIVEYAAPATEKRPTPRALAELFERTLETWGARRLPFRVRVEDGQPEAWLLVANPCGTRGELAQDAGAQALAVHSLAAAFQGSSGVTFEPWVTPEGVGLLLHAPREPHETPHHHAERLARAAGRALAGDPLDGRAVADARSKILDRLGADTGWWLALETLSGDFPSALEPFGTWKSVSTTSTSGVERARAMLARGPLKLAMLADHDGGQAEVAAAALADWLAPFRDDEAACPKPTFQAPTGGVWTLETIDEEIREGAYLGVWVPGARELGQATAYLLNRPGGWLDRALTKPGLVGSAQAHWFGGGRSGGLVIELGAPPDQLDAAIQQTRALLARLAEGAAEASEAALARAEQIRRDEALLRTPRGRIVRLWHERDPVPITLAALRELHQSMNAERHLVIRVKRRR